MTNERKAPVYQRAAATLDGVDFAERVITVIAVPYEEPAPVMVRGRVWSEVFSRGAFEGIESRLNESNPRPIPVTAVLKVTTESHDHSDNHLIGKVAEAFPARQEGLVVRAQVSKTAYGDETLQLAHDGALSASVGYAARASDIALDPQTMTRRVNRAFLDHLAFVAQPAFVGAKVLSVRGAATPEDEDDAPGLDEFLADPMLRYAAERAARTFKLTS